MQNQRRLALADDASTLRANYYGNDARTSEPFALLHGRH
jgi:hypothetical protein